MGGTFVRRNICLFKIRFSAVNVDQQLNDGSAAENSAGQHGDDRAGVVQDSDDQGSVVQDIGWSCNGISISFVIATVAVGAIGYSFASPYGTLAGVGGIVGGILLGFVATPFVFLLLTVLLHAAIKTEDWFHKPKK